MSENARSNENTSSSPVSEMLAGEQSHFFEAIIEGINEGVAVYDCDLRYVFVNRFFVESTGMSADEFIGRKVIDVFPQLRQERWTELPRRALAGETVETADRPFQLANREETIWIRTTFGPMRDAHGEIVGVLAVVRNVTERKRADEAALQLAREEAAHAQAKEAEQKIRRLIESIADPFFAISEEWTITYVNENAARFWSRSTDELLDHQLWELFPKAKHTEVYEQLVHALEQRVHVNFETPSPTTGMWVEVNAYPLDGGLSIYFRNIEERKRAEEARQRYEQELVSARRHAEEMEQLKSSLLANMSHEIRTPLTGILLQAEVLYQQLGPEHKASVERIVRSAHRLGRTLDSVLTFAQLESGMLEPHSQSIDLVAEVRQVADELLPLAKRKGLSLRVHTPEGPVEHVNLDATLVHRILTNLIANAIKFTEAGSVTISVAQTQTSCIIEVEDTGIGIPESFRDHLFEPFKQQSTGRGRTHEGSGLGLAITKRLLDALGADIEVHSEAGEGSRFTVRFPLEEARDTPRTASKAPPDEAAPTATPQGNGAILVVDDNPDIRELLEIMLTNRTVHTAESAEQALEMTEKQTYSAILMDISLPNLSGVEALHRLRDQKTNDSTPVIAMTGHAMPGDRQRLLEEGFDSYLAKPFTPNNLDAALAAVEE